VYDNNFPQSEWLHYLPEGHGQLDNVLFAPLIMDNEAVGIFGFANRPGGFCEESALIARTFAEIAAIGLLRNKTANRLRTVFEHMKGGGAVYKAVGDGEDFIIIDFHRPELQSLDKKSEDLRGKKILEVFPTIKEHGLFEVFQRVWKTGKPEIYPVKIYNDKEITGWRENYVYKLPTGEIVALYEDFTERKKMEMTLQASENLFRTIFESSPNPININRLEDGIFVRVNNKFLELTGFEKGEVIGKTALDINVWKSHAKRKEFFSLLYEKGQVISFYADFMCKDGSVVNAQVSAELITYKNKPHFIAVTQDISDLIKAEQDLQEAHIQLEKKFVLRTEELKESQINYRMIADFTYDWEWWTNLEGAFRYVSPACERITGYKADQFLENYNLLREVIVPEDRDKWDKHYHKYHEDVGLREIQFRIKRLDGDIRWIEHACQPVFTRENEFLGFRASNRDVTKRKQAEEKLHKTQKHYRDLVDNSLIGVFNSRYSNGEFVFVNDAMARIYDFESPEQMIAEKAVAGWKYPQKRKQMLSRLTKYGSVNNWNAEIITPAGHQRDVLFSAKLEDGIISGMVMDISRRVEVERKLQASEVNLKKAQEVAHIGSWYLDLLENNLVWSEENYKIFGIPNGSPLSYEKFLEIVHPEDRDYVDEKWHATIEGEPYDIEHRLLVDNEVKWVREKAELNYDHNGKPISGVGITQDITERKIAEEARKKTEEELRVLSNQLLSAEERERKRIANDIHDTIGQALSAVKFSVENSLSAIDNKSFSLAARSLESIIPLTQQAIEEVRRIIMDLRPSTLDDLGLIATISWLFREFGSIYNHIHIDKEIHLNEADIPLSLKSVIYRILQETLNNAAKHSQTKIIRFHLMKSGDSLEFLFEDSGVGFDYDKVQSKVAVQKGMGLGSMKERAQMSGGTFTIKSSPGIGTRIHISWPI
jgi:PAS domain S-box-containing protein